MYTLAMIIGGFEMLVGASILSLLSGLGILQRTEPERRGKRLFGRILIYAGGVVLVLFALCYLYSKVILRS